jgi:tRNA-specific 2-thiouridylase
VKFDEPQFASAPGQVLVLYADKGVVASAIIGK